jgi:hypothetical protein
MHLPSLVVAALCAALLIPAGAPAAVGHWASPAEVVPAAGDATPAPLVSVDAAGRSLVLAADAAKPVLARGDAAGAFGAPVALGPDAGPSTSLDAAPWADGGLVVAYASGGSAHVVFVTAGGAVGAPVELGGTGVNSLSVAVAPDTRAVVVAYRTKEADGSYGLLLRSAAAGSSAFGEATTLDAGPAFDSVDVAAGPNGAVAVVYRRLSGSLYGVWSVFRGGGLKNFDGPQVIGAGGDQSDLQPQVQVDGGGVFVAAWANPTGARSVVRGGGDNAWSSASPLGVDGEPTYSMDLTGTPAGGVAAAWSAGGVVRSAVRGSGASAAFSLASTVDEFPGPIGVEPAVAAAPDGTVTVLTVRPMEGEIRAVDVGGANELIGYGAPEAATPVAVAASGDRTVAVWKNAVGGFSAATRSESAPPSHGPGPKPPAKDHTAPHVSFAGKSKRLFFRKTPRQLSVPVRCDEACRVGADGSLRISVPGRKRPRVAPLRSFAGAAVVAGVQRVVLKLGPSTRKELSRSLRRRRGAVVYLNVSAVDASGNQARRKIQLSIKPKPRAKRARR